MAIKSSKASNQCETDQFLDEAKSMLEIDAYHENIVNLQGITYEISNLMEQELEVGFCKKQIYIQYLNLTWLLASMYYNILFWHFSVHWYWSTALGEIWDPIW